MTVRGRCPMVKSPRSPRTRSLRYPVGLTDR
jgi:hypothetical protein